MISAFVFATWIVQFLYFFYAKFQASSFLLWQYRPVCVGPGRKPKLLIFSRTGSNASIRKTCPCSVYPLKPHFCIVELGYVGVYLFFLFLLQNIDCGYSLEPPRRGGSNVYPQSVLSKSKKNIKKNSVETFQF